MFVAAYLIAGLDTENIYLLYCLICAHAYDLLVSSFPRFVFSLGSFSTMPNNSNGCIFSLRHQLELQAFPPVSVST